jgi:hypothetical protein
MLAWTVSRPFGCCISMSVWGLYDYLDAVACMLAALRCPEARCARDATHLLRPRLPRYATLRLVRVNVQGAIGRHYGLAAGPGRAGYV